MESPRNAIRCSRQGILGNDDGGDAVSSRHRLAHRCVDCAWFNRGPHRNRVDRNWNPCLRGCGKATGSASEACDGCIVPYRQPDSLLLLRSCAVAPGIAITSGHNKWSLHDLGRHRRHNQSGCSPPKAGLWDRWNASDGIPHARRSFPAMPHTKKSIETAKNEMAAASLRESVACQLIVSIRRTMTP